MALNNDFLMGFLSGTVVGAVGYRLYEQNGGQLQRLVQPQGAFNQKASSYQPSVEELVTQKERLEDMIAEMQLK
jgi:gas vesicle protein